MAEGANVGSVPHHRSRTETGLLLLACWGFGGVRPLLGRGAGTPTAGMGPGGRCGNGAGGPWQVQQVPSPKLSLHGPRWGKDTCLQALLTQSRATACAEPNRAVGAGWCWAAVQGAWSKFVLWSCCTPEMSGVSSCCSDVQDLLQVGSALTFTLTDPFVVGMCC